MAIAPVFRAFYHVGGEDLEKIDVLREIFDRILTPLYGSQDKAIQQIREGKDRTAFLLCEEEVPVGVLVFKTVLSDEFRAYGLERSIEIKSLFIDQSQQNSGRGLGSALVDKLKEEVGKLDLNPQTIHVTVSKKKEESLAFFRKKGFEVTHAWKGKYRQGVIEYLLSCPAILAEGHQKAEEIGAQEMPELTHIIHKAHWGNVHALVELPDGTIVSGSADNSIYQWDLRGELVEIVQQVEPTQQDERNWITAIRVINGLYWASGDRRGKIALWQTDGHLVKEIQPKLPKKGQHVSHEYNTKRVNCLAAGLDREDPTLFIGFPTIFDEYSLIAGRTVSSTKVHENDWIYCIHPLRNDALLAVVGSAVNVWKKQEREWRCTEQLVAEGKRVGRQRPFISSLTPLKASDHLFGLSNFTSDVQVLDINAKTLVRQWREHDEKVWATASISETVLASGGEDRTIKLWDLREGRSVRTLPNHVGEVTSLLSPKATDHLLVAGTCPPDSLTSAKGAEIRFYDIRK